jgi:polyketide-type polyunsaturated fatty acid synthase PfaA
MFFGFSNEKQSAHQQLKPDAKGVLMSSKEHKTLQNGKKYPLTPIVIIGLAGILPDAENLNQYWENILNEVNCIHEVPPSRWKIDEYYDPDPSVPDKTYSKYGGFIPDITFDPMEFGLPPNILEVTDVSQLISLMVAKNALTDAGYAEAGENILDYTGVILGMVGMASKVIHPLLNRLQYPVWEKVLRASSVPENEIPAIIEKMKLAYVAWNENAFPGAIGNVVAGRIANRLNLGGTNCIVDAACGSSLAAISMAISELSLGRADMMITGGVDTDNSILTYLCFSKTPAFSKGSQLRAFSADSDGMLSGEGIGMLVLKRLDDAERDHDRIYAVIRGVGTSSDGHFKSIYAPRPSGQAKALRRAYENAGFPPASVGLIEAHGTGTIAGDPAEFEGLNAVFGENNPEKQFIALGSVKSQIGHTKATAGAASMIKASLALHHKVLPATINVSKPQTDLDIENSPFYLNTETRPWFRNMQGNPRRAGVSSFGFGGTNFHIVLEEYQPEQGEAYRIHQAPYTILLSAQTTEQLLENCRETLAKLESADRGNHLNQLDQDSCNSVIPVENARVGFVAKSAEDACDNLRDCIKLLIANKNQESWSHPKGIYFRKSGMDFKGKTVALFPGQGSQYVNMGKELAINFPPFREAFEKANEIISGDGREPLTNIVYPIPVFSEEERQNQTERLTKTENAQPAIGTFSLALCQLLYSAGFQADFYAGHSFGELTALWASGVFKEDAFLRLAKARGESMSLPVSSEKDSGTMIAVKGDMEKVQNLLKDHDNVTIANFNSPTQVVLAGSTNAVQAIQPKLEEIGLKVYPLQVSAAFHTSFVEHAQAPFERAIQKETFEKPSGMVYSNSTAHEYEKNPQNISQILTGHILTMVRFKEEIENIYKSGGSIFIEIGPKNVLTNLVNDILNGQPHETITLNPNPKGDSDFQYRQAVLQMRVLGFNLGNIDPYRKYQDHSRPDSSKVSVILNGGLYTTEKTRSNFENALLKKPKYNHESAAIHPAVKQTPIENTSEPVSVLNFQNNSTSKKSESFPDLEVPQMNTDQQYIQSLIERFQVHQDGFLKAHEQFLQNDHASKKVIQEIAQAELSILSKMNGNPQRASEIQALSAMEKSAEIVNSQHNGTSEAHLEYIKSQTVFSQQYAALLKELIGSNGNHHSRSQDQVSFIEEIPQPMPSAPVMEEPSGEPLPVQVKTQPQADLPSSVKQDMDQLTQSFLQIVSEKTGYPTEMLELSMDMEADLGIDSIKRVEILGAMQEQYPELPTIAAENLVVLRTLEQIVGAFISTPQKGEEKEPAKQEHSPEPDTGKIEDKTANAVPESELQPAFLEIVSEKTGYPTDMLELGMDMEADLGIDSIKRVEILGAMQERFPQLPAIDAEELTMLRTLEQIIAQFNSGSQAKAVLETTSPAPTIIENAPSHPTNINCLPVQVKQIPQPDFLKFEMSEDGLVLITDDCTEKSRLLAESFHEQGLKVGLIHFEGFESQNTDNLPDEIQHIQLSKSNEDKIQSEMESIIVKNNRISAFIHMNPASNGNRAGILDAAESDAAILKSVFLIARQLKKPLTACGENSRPAFLTVTQMDGHFGLNGNSSNNPLSGGFSGLAKTLRLEWTNVFCRALDLHPDIDAQTAVKLINDELHDPNLQLTEVGYTRDGRYTLSLETES